MTSSKPDQMNDIELGSTPTFNISTGTSENSDEQHSTGCHIRWTRLVKKVEIQEMNSGLLRGSIAAPTIDSAEQLKNMGPVTKVILNEVSGSASPGEVLALMGPSGSGKTSLLNALSGRSSINSGMLTVDGSEATAAVMKRFKRKVAYVKQSDVFFEHLTVRDQLTYTALLRLPSNTPKAEKHREVNRIISLLRLTKCADTPIMMVSGGEKKRVNIGTELLTDPRVIMLDEPTSGLDSTSAVALLKMLHSLAKDNGKTVVTSIHQPSSAVFRSFDRLLMLADGNVVYFGTPSYSLEYLKISGYECPSGYNAADHWMDLLVVDSAMDDNTERMLTGHSQSNEDDSNLKQSENTSPKQKLIKSWDKEAVANENLMATQNSNTHSPKNAIENIPATTSDQKYNTTWRTQCMVLMHRCLKNSRSAIFTKINLLKSGAIGLMIGLLYFHMEYTERTVTDRVSYYFFTMTYWVFDAMFGALMAFPSERAVILKERASGSYHLSAYFMAKTLSEMPTRLLLPFIYMVISYWLAWVNPDVGVFFGSTGCTLLCVLAGESIGLFIGAAVMDLEQAMVIMTVSALGLMVVGGFFVQNIPAFAAWLKYLSPFKYAFDASQQLVFNLPVPCDGSGVLEVCKGKDAGFATVDEVLKFLNAQGTVGFNAGMMFVIIFVARYFAFLALKRQKAGERS